MRNEPGNPFKSTVMWLATHAQFPACRLDRRPEIMLCMAALASIQDETAGPRYLVQGKDNAMTAAQRAHAERRKHAHFKSDNSAKV